MKSSSGRIGKSGHGGGWVNGAGMDVPPTWLVAEGDVVVTVNYGLGALGYLALPTLDAESADKQSSGQYGHVVPGLGSATSSATTADHDQLSRTPLQP